MSAPRRPASPIRWAWRLRHARGYRALGLLAEAARELRGLPKTAEVLREVTCYHQEGTDWRRMAREAKLWTRLQPTNEEAWISLGYATRRSANLLEATKVLLRGLQHHPRSALLHFNLSCYAAQLGDLEKARTLVERSIQLDPRMSKLAREDDDLAPLRAAGLLPT